MKLYGLTKRRGVSAGGRGGSISGGGIGSGGGSKSGSSGGGSKGGSSSGGGYGSSGGSSGRSGTPGRTITSGRSSLGGGTPRTIAGGSPFAGRSFGGGQRAQIYSGRGYGGGYYGSGYRGGIGFLPVFGLGFPFGFWPLYVGPRYYGNDEYGPHNNSSRPGGPLAMASFSSPSSSTTAPPEYSLYGDSESIGNVTEALNSNCSAVTIVASTVLTANGTLPSGVNASLLPLYNPNYTESYFRASSFALSSFFDDNDPDPAAVVNFTAPTPPPTLYPASARDATFEACLNDTISNALPIEQGSWAVKSLQPSKAGAGLAAVLVVVLGGGRSQAMVMVAVLLVLMMSA